MFGYSGSDGKRLIFERTLAFYWCVVLTITFAASWMPSCQITLSSSKSKQIRQAPVGQYFEVALEIPARPICTVGQVRMNFAMFIMMVSYSFKRLVYFKLAGYRSLLTFVAG